MNQYEQNMLTAAALEYLNRTDTRGIITSPGKFEGEHISAVALWNIALEGFADIDSTDCDGTPYFEFFMSRSELADYGLESHASDDIDSYYVVLVESEQGFVTMSVNTSPVADDCDDSDYDEFDDESDDDPTPEPVRDMPLYIYLQPFDESAYSAARAIVDAQSAYLNEHKKNWLSPEESALFPITNDERSAIELYEWKRDNPQHYVVYVSTGTLNNYRNGRATTWTGDLLGRVVLHRKSYSPVGGVFWVITVYGSNGISYYGRWFYQSGDAAVIHAYKNQSR